MSAVLFYDPECRQPYDGRTLCEQPMGGSEATLARIAIGLGAYVMQHNRTTAYQTFLPPGRIRGIGDVVVSRDPGELAFVHELFPRARLHLWIHDALPWGSKRARRLAMVAGLLRELSVTLICVSNSQRVEVERIVRALRIETQVRVRTIYNPVSDHIRPDRSRIDSSKLVFFSSPNKGLHFALDAFRAVRRHLPDMYFCIGNPGYRSDAQARIEGVKWLGALPQEKIHEEVRTALCTFTPNFVLPETFGLVFAESNALGTPVLTHDCGAASEVLADRRQFLPVPWGARLYESSVRKLSVQARAVPARLADQFGLFDCYIQRILAWKSESRPLVSPDPRFRLSNVLESWRSLLGLSSCDRPDLDVEQTTPVSAVEF